MGTRFMCTVESPIHQAIKERIVQGDERRRPHLPLLPQHRAGWRATPSPEVLQLEREGRPFEDVAPLVAGARGSKVYEDATQTPALDRRAVQGLINDVPTCAELIERIVLGANESSPAGSPGSPSRPRWPSGARPTVRRARGPRARSTSSPMAAVTELLSLDVGMRVPPAHRAMQSRLLQREDRLADRARRARSPHAWRPAR